MGAPDAPSVFSSTREKRYLRTFYRRIEFVAHDFLTDQPVVSDAYFLRVVLHSWPDEYCVKILRQLVPAVRNNTRIVVNDSVVSEPGTLPLLGMRNIYRFPSWGSAYGMLMMTLCNARKREEDNWTQLLRDTDASVWKKEDSRPRLKTGSSKGRESWIEWGEG